MRAFIALACTAAAFLPSIADAHGGSAPRHGGIMFVSGETQIEAVTTPDGLDVYVSEEDQPLAASGLSGNAIIKEDASAGRVTLEPVDGNRLIAPGLVPAKGQSVVVTIIDKASGLRSFATYNY